jgi:hypothetical protein
MAKDILKEIEDSDELQIRDDDHLDRKELTEEEADIAFKQLLEKHKDMPKINGDPKKLSDATIKAMNSKKLLD